MEPALLLLVIIAVAYFWARDHEKAARSRLGEMEDLRFVMEHESIEPGETFRSCASIDFRDMLFIDEASDHTYHHTKLFNVLRLARFTGTGSLAAPCIVRWETAAARRWGSPWVPSWLPAWWWLPTTSRTPPPKSTARTVPDSSRLAALPG